MKKEILQPEKRPQLLLLVLLPERIATGTFMPRTMVEWNAMPATIREAPYIDTLKARLAV